MIRVWRRGQAAAGIVGIVVVAVGLVLPGTPPKTSDSVEHVTRTLIANRSEFLASTYVLGLGCLLLLLFMGALRSHLGGDGHDALATSAVGAGYVAIALLMAGAAAFDGLAFTAAGMHDGAVVRALVDAGNAVLAMAGLAFAVLLLTGSAAAARTGALPKPVRVLGYAGGALLVVSGLALAVDHGPLQSGGAINLAGTAPTILWIAATSIVMLRAPSTSSG
jgi:hypothetical protein